MEPPRRPGGDDDDNNDDRRKGHWVEAGYSKFSPGMAPTPDPSKITRTYPEPTLLTDRRKAAEEGGEEEEEAEGDSDMDLDDSDEELLTIPRLER